MIKANKSAWIALAILYIKFIQVYLYKRFSVMSIFLFFLVTEVNEDIS